MSSPQLQHSSMTLRSNMEEEFKMYNKKLSPGQDALRIGRSEFDSKIIISNDFDRLKRIFNLQYNVPLDSPIYCYQPGNLLKLYRYYTPIQNGESLFSANQPDLKVKQIGLFFKTCVFPTCIIALLSRKYVWFGLTLNGHKKLLLLSAMISANIVHRLPIANRSKMYEQTKVCQNYQYFEDLIQKHHAYLFQGGEPLPFSKKEPTREECIQETMRKIKEKRINEKKSIVMKTNKRITEVQEVQSSYKPDQQDPEEQLQEEDQEQEPKELKEKEIPKLTIRPADPPITKKDMPMSPVSPMTTILLNEYLTQYSPITTRANQGKKDPLTWLEVIYLFKNQCDPFNRNVIQRYFDEKREQKQAQFTQEAIRRLEVEQEMELRIKQSQSQLQTHSQ